MPPHTLTIEAPEKLGTFPGEVQDVLLLFLFPRLPKEFVRLQCDSKWRGGFSTHARRERVPAELGGAFAKFAQRRVWRGE
jgi:hypothetical protein